MDRDLLAGGTVKQKVTLPLRAKLINLLESFSFLASNEKKTLLRFGLLQSISSLLDIVGITLIGLVGALTIQGVTGIPDSSLGANQVLKILNMENLNFQSQVLFFSISACLALIARSLIAFKISQRILNFLGNVSSGISAKILRVLLSHDVAEIERYAKQDLIYLLNSSTSRVSLEVAGSLTFIFADSLSIIFTIIALLVIDIQATILTLFLFLGLGAYMFSRLKREAYELGSLIRVQSIKTNTMVSSVVENFRFLTTSGLSDLTKKQYGNFRAEQAQTQARLSFLPYISKYVFEIIIVLGALIVAGVQLFRYNISEALSTLTIFLAAGSRVAPMALRIQQSLLQVRSNAHLIKPVSKLIKEFNISTKESSVRLTEKEFTPRIEVSNLRFRYPDSELFQLKNISFEIEAGTFCAIVGPSGCGKSTLIDLISGLNSPTSGKVKLSNVPANLAVRLWEGKLGYVPQRTNIISASVAENVRFGRNKISDDDIWDALENVGLRSRIRQMKLKLNTQIGEEGINLSMGQQQRIMIARTIVTKPRIILMDEPTSSLDPISERIITRLFHKLRPYTTLVVVAHKLHTVKNADKILFMENGKVTSSGTFKEVRQENPSFENFTRRN